ncbi:MAG TPA: sodium:proton antiporter [Brevundimonas sp.]|jgi:CPA1 family monovalent cation:H+ antiporter|uniref:cation:proton antiporter n=1 Tax=Brevundimonas aurantiaca TaxID=74316 RepID=UPI000C92BCF1|nr:sodium:proton antiporter [Brevundimonas sp.]HAF80197.1 sodium:proton antiporter [Brevundimonas sp.]
MPIHLSPFDAAAILIVLSAVLGWVNHRYFRLPGTVAMTLMGAVASLCVIAADAVFQGSDISAQVSRFLDDIDFHDTLMNGMLSFLLFAGALHVDIEHLRRGRWQIAILSTIGVAASTLIVGFGLKALTGLVGMEAPLIWCFVFGALISPTDPVAVMGVLKTARVPPTLQATIAGESLFNDGVGVVVFSILLASAVGGEAFSIPHAGEMFVVEALGGALLGAVIGWIAYRAMKMIDDYSVEVMITLATVMGGYALATALHISGPVAMAVAGLIVGNPGVSYAMSDTTKDYVLKFWALIDEVLNAVLFLLIGLEAVVLADSIGLLGLGLLTIPLVLAARAVSVGAPLLFWRRLLPLPLAFPVMTWGGLRGGISIALALSLPEGPMKDVILAATYMVVLFSVLAQGATIGGLVRRSVRRASAAVAD